MCLLQESRSYSMAACPQAGPVLLQLSTAPRRLPLLGGFELPSQLLNQHVLVGYPSPALLQAGSCKKGSVGLHAAGAMLCGKAW